MIGIYKIQSKIKPDRIYIGSSIELERRLKRHLSKLRAGKHQKKLQRHFNKYGENDLVLEIIELCSKEDLLKKEQKYINSIHPWFNMSDIAGGGNRWCFLSAEESDKIKKRLSEKFKNRNITWGDKIGESLKGKKHSAESYQSQGEKMRGRVPWNKGLILKKITI